MHRKRQIFFLKSENMHVYIAINTHMVVFVVFATDTAEFYSLAQTCMHVHRQGERSITVAQ